MAIGKKFVSWGLGLFVFGIFLSFGIIAHYCVGAAWPTGELFKQNITLWWACPWTLSVATVQIGGLGMVAIGLVKIAVSRLSPKGTGSESHAAWALCVTGLLGTFAVGYPGYFVFDAFWPSFFYSPVAAGKNAWLLGQAFFVALYFLGALLAFASLRSELKAMPST